MEELIQKLDLKELMVFVFQIGSSEKIEHMLEDIMSIILLT